MSSPLAFARSPELLYQLFHLLEWQELMKLSRTEKFLRGKITTFIQKYIANNLNDFIPYEKQEVFWTMLDDTGSVICGDFIITLLLCIPRHGIMGEICDVITPHGQLETVINTMRLLGYDRTTPEDIDLNVSSSAVSCSQVVFMIKSSFDPVSNFYLNIDTCNDHSIIRQPRTTCFVIKESVRRDYMYTLLHERTTVEMCALSARTIICAYSGATLKHRTYPNKSLRSRANLPAATYSKFCVTIVNPSINFFQPCGAICPLQVRNTSGLQGFGVFFWNLKNDLGLLETVYSWRLGNSCRNPSCDNFNITILPPAPTLFGHNIYLEDNIAGDC